MPDPNQQSNQPPIPPAEPFPATPPIEEMTVPFMNAGATEETGTPPPADIPPMITHTKTKKFGGKKIIATILGILVLVGGVVAGTILVRQRQEVREKAAGTCDNRFPADPATSCGQTTQSPTQDATNVSLTPDFHWDYGGYRPADGGQCIDTSGCPNYHVTVFLAKVSVGANPFNENYEGVCSLGPTTTPIKDAPLSCFKVWDKANKKATTTSLTALDPNTDYYWIPFTSFGGCPTCFHTGWSWSYHFKTAGTAPTTGQCLNVNAWDTNWKLLTSQELSALKPGDKVRFNVAGQTTSGSFDKARFTINGTLRPEVTTKRPGTTSEFYDEYTIPAGTNSFSVKGELYHTTLGWF